MAFDLTLLLLAAGVLSSTETQEAYNKLSESYRKGVDLALEQVNNHPTIKQHFLFFQSLGKSDVKIRYGTSHFYHNFNLKATRCARGAVNPDPTKCPFRNNRPLLDCVACYNTYNEDIEPDPKPYIHCIHKPSLNREVQKKRRDHCDGMNHFTGGATLLGAKPFDPQLQ